MPEWMKDKKAGKIYIVLYFAMHVVFLFMPFLFVPIAKLGLCNTPLLYAVLLAMLEENTLLMTALLAAALTVFVFMILSLVTITAEKSRFYPVPIIFSVVDIIFHVIFQYYSPPMYIGLIYKILGLVIYINLLRDSIKTKRRDTREKTDYSDNLKEHVT